MENLASALFDLYDVRAALTRQEKQRPKDNDGSSITIGDCLDDAISFLESLEYIMKTIILDRARYTVRDDRHTFLSDILKLTGKHKPVRPRGGDRRLYPTDGAVSTADYVAQYYALNSGRWPKLQGSPYGLNNTLAGFYEGLSDRVTVPMGEDSVEVCHED